MDREKVMAEMSEKVIQSLSGGNLFWQQPWTDEKIGFHFPVNAETGKRYNGSNFFMLNLIADNKSFQSPTYATMKQWNKLGERIKKGESPSPIIKYDVVEKELEDGKVKKSAWLKQYWVFNESQTVGFKGIERPEPRSEFEFCDAFDDFVDHTGIEIEVSNKMGACFIPSKNKIHMPPQTNFIDTQGVSASVNFYNVLGHEVGHATGHESRLNRDLTGKYGSKEYAREEMIAEFISTMLLYKHGIAIVAPVNSVTYAAAWAKRIGEDPYLFHNVCKEATRAFDWLENAFKENKAIAPTLPANDNCNPCQIENGRLLRFG